MTFLFIENKSPFGMLSKIVLYLFKNPNIKRRSQLVLNKNIIYLYAI